MREVNNSEDILDSRDVIARRDELKEEWYLAGGFAEPRCVRVTRGRSWAYFYRMN